MDEKVCLVTGSTRGLGRAIAEGLAGAGASVVISSRSAHESSTVAEEIASATGAHVVGAPCDVGDWDSIAPAVDRIVATMGRVDVLVNNAGVNPRPTSIVDISQDRWRDVLGVNLEGPLRMTQCVAPVMRDSGGGSVVNVGSMIAYGVVPDSAIYGTSKAALRYLTLAMAQELSPWNIRVNIVSPGPFRTEMMEAAEAVRPGALSLLSRMTAQKRIADLPEIVGPVLYLASDAASFVTGDDITVSGGMRK